MFTLKFFTGTGVFLSLKVPSPSCPNLLSPQAQTVQSDFRARPCCHPEPISIISSSPSILTGIFLSESVPSPNCPLELFPHENTFPSEFKARLCQPLVATLIIFAIFITCPGVRLSSKVEPSPNCPYRLFPHVHTVPSDTSARLCIYPPCIFETSLRPFTNTGAVLFVLNPFPSCP